MTNDSVPYFKGVRERTERLGDDPADLHASTAEQVFGSPVEQVCERSIYADAE